MKKYFVVLITGVMLLALLAGCGTAATAAPSAEETEPAQEEAAEPAQEETAEPVQEETAEPASIQIIDLDITSVRDTAVKTTVELPAEMPEAGYPLVIMIHGTSGSRSEGGKFDDLAKVLAENGIASIRMDFPGCNESEEDATLDIYSNRLDDIASCYAWFAENYTLDESRIGILGYSLGTQIAPLAATTIPTAAMALWSPNTANLTEDSLRYGYTLSELLELTAETGRYDGLAYGLYPTTFTYDGVMDWLNYQPLTALSEFAGKLLFVTGDEDAVVGKDVSNAAIDAAVNASQKSLLNIYGVGHLLGAQEMDNEAHAMVVYSTASFFISNLAAENTLGGITEN